MGILHSYIPDEHIRALIQNIVSSFCSEWPTPGVGQIGLPLGNLTSQLLVNIYMNEFDQFAKHGLKAKHYIRYADDFVFLSPDRNHLVALIPRVSTFLRDRLKLELHPNKVSIQALSSGVDFLGWVHFLNHRVLRTSTKRRMLKAFGRGLKEESITSYCGMLSHGNTIRLMTEIKK